MTMMPTNETETERQMPSVCGDYSHDDDNRPVFPWGNSCVYVRLFAFTLFAFGITQQMRSLESIKRKFHCLWDTRRARQSSHASMRPSNHHHNGCRHPTQHYTTHYSTTCVSICISHQMRVSIWGGCSSSTISVHNGKQMTATPTHVSQINQTAEQSIRDIAHGKNLLGTTDIVISGEANCPRKNWYKCKEIITARSSCGIWISGTVNEQ